jgi:hypothetical protein
VNAGIPAIKGALNRLRDENIYEYAIKEGFVRINVVFLPVEFSFDNNLM